MRLIEYKFGSRSRVPTKMLHSSNPCITPRKENRKCQCRDTYGSPIKENVETPNVIVIVMLKWTSIKVTYQPANALRLCG